MSLELLAAWRPLLAELGALGTALCDAIEGDDVIAAIAAMMQLRRVRSAISRVEAPALLHGSREELRAMREVSSLTIDARAAEGAMARWLERALPGDDDLLSTPLGVAVLADAILPVVWDFETDVVILVGSGFESVAQVLSDLGQRRIVIVDPAPAVRSAVAVHAESSDEAVAAVRTMAPGSPTQMVVRASLASAPGLVEKVVEVLREALSDLRVHRNTVRAFSRTWIEQGMANLPAMARFPSIAALDEAFAGKPMVIVAPGPSLANNVHLLRSLRSRAIVTAFSHSLKPLLAAGVIPDFVITVDPQDVQYHFAGCDLSQTCLVNAATAHPSLFELPAARHLTLSANCAIDDWIFDGLGEDALVPGGGSVATTAYSLALRWACDPIVFVGLDLSFPGGAYYVSTSSDGAARARIDDHGVMQVDGWSDGFRAMKARGGPAAACERVIELPGWHGGVVPSSFMFSLFHRWFEQRTGQVGGVTVYNCTEGGARISGMAHCPLADVLATLDGKVDVAGALDAARDAVDVDGRARKLARHIGGLGSGLRRARRLVTLGERLIAGGDTTGRLERVERVLANTLRPLMFASLLAQRELDRAQDIASRPAAASDYLAASTALLATLRRVIDQLEPALHGALATLRERQERAA